MEESIGTKPTEEARNTLKAWAAQMARKEAKTRLVEPKQAPYVEPREMKKLGEFLWKRAVRKTLDPRQKTAVITSLAYVTGARIGEICEVQIEDIEETMDNGTKFIRLP